MTLQRGSACVLANIQASPLFNRQQVQLESSAKTSPQTFSKTEQMLLNYSVLQKITDHYFGPRFESPFSYDSR